MSGLNKNDTATAGDTESLERSWDKAWDLFTKGEGPEPPNHPKLSHPYNVDRKKFIENEQGGQEEDDY